MELIVAVDEGWAIGKDGDQLVYLREDLKHFRTMTDGHTVIMGRRTLAALPGGRPLAGRRNLVLSAAPGCRVEGARVCGSLDQVLDCAGEDAFVIGGESVYRLLLPFCRRAHVTKIHARFSADRWFPNLDEDLSWRVEEESPLLYQDGLGYHYVTYVRVSESQKGDKADF